jgi:hypothetical protein
MTQAAVMRVTALRDWITRRRKATNQSPLRSLMPIGVEAKPMFYRLSTGSCRKIALSLIDLITLNPGALFPNTKKRQRAAR